MNTEDCPHCGEDISDVTHGLKNALEKTRDERTQLKAKESKAKDDLAKANTLLEDANNRLKDSDPEKMKQLQTDFENLTSELEESKATVTGLQDEATQGKIASAVAKAGGNLAMLSPMIKAKLVENPKLDLDEHLTTLRNDADFGGAFKSSDQSGGGSDPGKANDSRRIGITSMPVRRSEMSDKQKNEFQKTHGLSALLDLPL